MNLQEQVMLEAQRQEENNVSEDYKVQYNLKLGETLINLRGGSVEELAAQLTEFAENADAILGAHDTIRQVALAKNLTTVGGFVPGPSGSSDRPSAAQGSSSGDLRCQHGPYKDFKGKTKVNGQPYQYRYYCSGPYGKGCKATDLAGQEAWS